MNTRMKTITQYQCSRCKTWYNDLTRANGCEYNCGREERLKSCKHKNTELDFSFGRGNSVYVDKTCDDCEEEIESYCINMSDPVALQKLFDFFKRNRKTKWVSDV